jgi:replicative DNA helicase
MVNADVYAEQGTLASVLIDPSIIQDVSEILTDEDFNEPRHKEIFSSIMDLFRNGKPIMSVTVAEHLRERGLLSGVGGVDFLSTLTDPMAPYSADADGIVYAEIVKDESIRRTLHETARNIATMSKLDSGVPSSDIIAMSQEALRAIADRNLVKDSASPVAGLKDDFFARIIERGEHKDGLQGIPSGLIDLDKKTTGFHPGQFIIIAARPAIGKSTLAVDFCRAASIKAGFTSMFFSLEMSKDEIMDRMSAAESNVLLDNIRSGKLSNGELDRLGEAWAQIAAANIVVDDSPTINIDHIRASSLRQATSPEGLDLIIIDYLQLMTSNKRVESRQQEVSEFSRSLKLLAKELGVPVIALSQLNRGPENRTEKQPKMSDMRESGSLEQDADIVIMLHAQADEATSANKIFVLLEKNRNGQAPVRIEVAPLLEYSKFGNGGGMYAATEPREDDEDGQYPEDNESGMIGVPSEEDSTTNPPPWATTPPPPSESISNDDVFSEVPFPISGRGAPRSPSVEADIQQSNTPPAWDE